MGDRFDNEAMRLFLDWATLNSQLIQKLLRSAPERAGEMGINVYTAYEQSVMDSRGHLEAALDISVGPIPKESMKPADLFTNDPKDAVGPAPLEEDRIYTPTDLEPQKKAKPQVACVLCGRLIWNDKSVVTRNGNVAHTDCWEKASPEERKEK